MSNRTNRKIASNAHWTFAYDASADLDVALQPDTCGKWMCFFDADGHDAVLDAVCAAVDEGACAEAKMSSELNMALHGGSGVACFYIDGSDADQHRRLLSFMLGRGLFPHGRGGLSDEPFKFDWQTRDGLYGQTFVPEITLSDYVDLETGELLP